MHRARLVSLLLTVVLVSVSFSVENEFVEQKKEKVFYPSCQQYIELDGEIIDAVNSGIKYLVDVQRSAITDINLYVEGDKDCFLQRATKHQRAKAYAHKLKIKNALHAILAQLNTMNDQ